MEEKSPKIVGILYNYFCLNRILESGQLIRLIRVAKLRPPATLSRRISSLHSHLLNIIILKCNSPVLLNLLGNIFPYCPAVGAIQRINSSNIDLPGRSMHEL